MAYTHRSRTIAAAAHEIWDVLADFGSISAWADNVDHSCILTHGPDGQPQGTTRRIQVGRNTLVERITEFDPPDALAYDIEGLPKPPAPGGQPLDAAPDAGRHRGHVDQHRRNRLSPNRNNSPNASLCRVLARQSDVMLAGLANRMEKTRV